MEISDMVDSLDVMIMRRTKELLKLVDVMGEIRTRSCEPEGNAKDMDFELLKATKLRGEIEGLMVAQRFISGNYQVT